MSGVFRLASAVVVMHLVSRILIITKAAHLPPLEFFYSFILFLKEERHLLLKALGETHGILRMEI